MSSHERPSRVEAWLVAVLIVGAVALEGLVLGSVADFFLKRWHPERPSEDRE